MILVQHPVRCVKLLDVSVVSIEVVGQRSGRGSHQVRHVGVLVVLSTLEESDDA